MTIRWLVKALAVCAAFAVITTGAWAAGEGEGASEAMSEKEMVTDPSSGKQFTAPQYGGTMTIAHFAHTLAVDTYSGGPAVTHIAGVVEKLAMMDWAVDRDTWALNCFCGPIEYMRGQLAESWEQTDPLTVTVKLRPEVYWHDKEPVNGRQFVADDVVYNYTRYIGLGDGDASPFIDRLGNMVWDSITAPDDHTVVFKLQEPQAWFLYDLLWHEITAMYAPEVIEAGNVTDWESLVGTGPFMLTDVQEGSSLTWERNPNYWGHDEKYPENQLPYADALKALVIPEPGTRLAAFRTGQIDLGFSQHGASVRTPGDLEGLLRTNPDMQYGIYNFRSDYLFMINVENPPLDDIRVRRALQLAINLDEINDALYDGQGNATPRSMSAHIWVPPYDQWPEELQFYFKYNPEHAEELLDEAGLPRGADGTRVTIGALIGGVGTLDATYWELVQGYYADIGVELELQPEDGSIYADRMAAVQYDLGMSEGTSQMIEEHLVGRFYGDGTNQWQPNTVDPEYNALIEEMRAATTLDEYADLWGVANLFLLEKQWIITAVEPPQWNIVQPWIQGWNGENMLGRHQYVELYGRLWIDQDLKDHYLN